MKHIAYIDGVTWETILISGRTDACLLTKYIYTNCFQTVLFVEFPSKFVTTTFIFAVRFNFSTHVFATVLMQNILALGYLQRDNTFVLVKKLYNLEKSIFYKFSCISMNVFNYHRYLLCLVQVPISFYMIER